MKALLSILLFATMASAASVTFPNDPPPPPKLVPVPPPPPIIDDAWVRVDGSNLLFALFFTHQPDYAHESFQWYLSTNESLARPMITMFTDFIVRSDHIGEGNVKVCSARPFGSGCPGGWGIDYGNIPTEWDGDFLQLTFSAPLTIFNDSTMSFDVISMEDGAQRDILHGTVQAQAPQIQPPDTGPVGVGEASSLLLVGIAGIGLLGLKRRAAK